MSDQEPLYGAVEAGGTKFVCAVGSEPDRIVETTRFSTSSPDETIRRTVEFFRPWEGRMSALGIGSFGPLDIHPESSTYGAIQKTPKPGWSDVNIMTGLKPLGLPVSIEMDVAVSALGEFRWGEGRGLTNFLYLTIGTGIGGTCLIHGQPLKGMAAPEMGHLFLPPVSNDDFDGICPFHRNCLEGLASGPAIEARWGRSGENLEEGHRGWQIEAEYLASALANYILTLSPQRIILGGGVMQNTQLFPLIRDCVRRLLNRYVDWPQITRDLDRYIVPPALGSRSGILGCFVLAERASSSG